MKRGLISGDTQTIAQRLLGYQLCRALPDGRILRGRIIETEAYLGPHDLAAHTAKGRTPRNEVMWGKPGHAYVYFVYGMHHCVNVVTEHGAAVLIRALDGLDDCNGPARLCKTLAIDRALNGVDLCKSELLWLEPGKAKEAIKKGPRIGVDYARHWAKRHLRFWLDGTAHSRQSRLTARRKSRPGPRLRVT